VKIILISLVAGTIRHHGKEIKGSRQLDSSAFTLSITLDTKGTLPLV
jgi:hypothetical protein